MTASVSNTDRTAVAGAMSAKRGGRPLNVLWLIDHVCYDGSLHGGGRLFMSLLSKFDPQRIRVFPYFLRASEEVRRVFANAPVPVTTLDKAKYDPTALIDIDAICRRQRIDVMHLYCYASSTLGRLVGRWRGIPTVIHDFDTQVYFPYPLYLKVLDRALAGGTGYAFAASSFCRDYMHEVRRVPEELIEVMFHSIPAAQLARSASLTRQEARTRLGWPEGDFVFAAITKLGPERGNETLIDAFRRCQQRVPHARLVFVYKPTLYHRVPKEYENIEWIRDADAMRERMRKLIADAGVGDAVSLVESLDSPDDYYAASDVLMAPFENVRFSSVNLIEGMAYGRPHIVTRLGEPFEIVRAWRSGLVVAPGDAAEMSDAMTQLAQNPARLHELGAMAKAASRHFTTAATVERLSDIYSALAERRRPAPAGFVHASG
jgi:glycosyltransferase involved in cell wall biosynthesis